MFEIVLTRSLILVNIEGRDGMTGLCGSTLCRAALACGLVGASLWRLQAGL